jgi:hypothetical protein
MESYERHGIQDKSTEENWTLVCRIMNAAAYTRMCEYPRMMQWAVHSCLNTLRTVADILSSYMAYKMYK